jgi:hypothetical protein
MQDSLEDFIRISRNTKEGPAQVKKEVLITAQIKQECDTKAMQILHFAIEGKMRSDALFKCVSTQDKVASENLSATLLKLPYINQAHYQDIVEERAISKLCGYPLCAKHIPDMPKKQFYISTKNNKIYDITDRKNYCSNFCYRASIHIKAQIDNSPLWLRKHQEKAHFTLLHKSEKGLPGEVVDQGIIKPVLEPLFTSVYTFTQMSLDEAEEYELNPQEEESKKQVKKPKKFQKNTMKTINENEEEDQIETESDYKSDHIKKDVSLDRIDIEEGFKPVASCDKENQQMENINITKTKENPATSRKIACEIDVESLVHKCFKEWVTLETYMLICGEDKVKEKLDSQKLTNYFESLKVAELEVEQQKRFVDICRKLHLKELAEEKFDNAVTGNEVLKPLPDFHELKEESQQRDLKVKAFYSGELHIQENTNFPTKKKEEDSTKEDEGPLAILPLVDLSSQNALRRKIFLNSLNKTVQVLCQTLRISPSLVLSDLQTLVKTFTLKADNIVFKPAIWNYIAIILLKILSIKDEHLQNILDEDKSKEQLNLWLSSLPHKGQLVDDILKFLSDVDSFIENYITCK